MEWQELGAYRGYPVWVKPLEGGRGLAAVTPRPEVSEPWPTVTPPSDEQVLPEGCESKLAAIERDFPASRPTRP